MIVRSFVWTLIEINTWCMMELGKFIFSGGIKSNGQIVNAGFTWNLHLQEPDDIHLSHIRTEYGIEFSVYTIKNLCYDFV